MNLTLNQIYISYARGLLVFTSPFSKFKQFSGKKKLPKNIW